MNLLTIEEALRAVLGRSVPLAGQPTGVAEALGLVLAEDVTADLDSPPFDKSVVDGFAVRVADLAGENRRLRVGEEITAGNVPTRPLARGEAAAVMTGAPLPAGADAVVMFERTRRDGTDVLIDETTVAAGQNALARGRETRVGDVVLAAGRVLTPARLGLLASVGRVEVRVVPPPRVAVVATGDELVEPGRVPGPGQIRNSNAPMLRALAHAAGAVPDVLPLAPDEPDVLRATLARGLDADVLLVSGGVSAGTRDLVPAALADLGVEQVFHKVNMKPGKPLWFGVAAARAGRPDGRTTLVFGLPGNPVSGLVGFLVFVRPALARLAGRPDALPTVPARLTSPFSHSGSRPSYVPARWSAAAGTAGAVTPLNSAGSGDLRTAAAADGFALFEAGDRVYVAGEIVPFLPLG